MMKWKASMKKWNRQIVKTVSPIFYFGTGHLFCIPGPTAGIIGCRIDGTPYKELDTYTEWSKYLYIPWVYMLETDLNNTEHKLELRISKEKNSDSIGSECQIRYFVVNR